MNKYIRNKNTKKTFTIMTFNLAVYYEMVKPYNKKFDEMNRLTSIEINTIREKLNGFINIEAKAPDIICTQEDLIGEKDIIGFPLNYKIISSCRASKSDWAKDDTTYLSNKILMHNNFGAGYTCISGIEDKCLKNISIINKRVPDRCTAIADFKIGDKKIRIANVHLCGGRFDDLNFKDLINEKADEILKVIEQRPDIIVGDFNSYIDKEHAQKHLSDYVMFKNLDKDDKDKFLTWASNVHFIIQKAGYLTLKQVGDTSKYGGMIDWIYYHRDSGIKMISLEKIIAMYGTEPPYRSNISDHNALVAKFEIL